MAVYSANKPNRTVTLHKDGCRHIKKQNIIQCGCGSMGRTGSQKWYCELHVTKNDIDQFMGMRFWSLHICDVCYK